MDFPNRVELPNGSVMSGEEVFLRGLYELTTGSKKTLIAREFGRHYTDQSRAFTFFIRHLHNKFLYLVQDNLAWWFNKGHAMKSAQLIQSKLALRSDYTNVFAFFIDCNCEETCRPGGGPAEGGANAARWSPEVQESFYNGWKSVHGLKHQTLDSAFGITVDMFGPTSLRRNDLILLRDSNINDRMNVASANQDYQLCLFGDSAYKVNTNIRSYIKGNEEIPYHLETDEQKDIRRWNTAFKRVRISIEWNYAVTATLFAYVTFKKKLKILESPTTTKVYIVATILRNFYTCLYGNETSKYFHYEFSDNFLEQYINQT
jgi:hypothetical protein